MADESFVGAERRMVHFRLKRSDYDRVRLCATLKNLSVSDFVMESVMRSTDDFLRSKSDEDLISLIRGSQDV